jgi:membrane protein
MTSKPHFFDAIYSGLQKLAIRLSRRPVIGALTRAGLRSARNKDKDMAASIAYYAFLSLFPMVLGLFAIAGQLIEARDAQERLTEYFVGLFPISSDAVARNIESLVQLRGPMGAIGVILLMWSAKKMVSAIRRSINNALGFSRPFARYLGELRDFSLTISITVIVFLTLAITPLIEVLGEFQFDFVGDEWNSFFRIVSGRVARFLASATLIAAVYLLVPFKRLTLREIVPGVLLATFAIELGKELFSIYITQISPLQPVYGSVSTVIATLIWLYFSARVLLYGSELIAVLRIQRDPGLSIGENAKDEKTDSS